MFTHMMMSQLFEIRLQEVAGGWRKLRNEELHDLHASLDIAGKGKAIPLQAWTGRECSRRLRLPDFKTIGT
jgi:hypothetical protein